jgi:hypothetical protein
MLNGCIGHGPRQWRGCASESGRPVAWSRWAVRVAADTSARQSWRAGRVVANPAMASSGRAVASAAPAWPSTIATVVRNDRPVRSHPAPLGGGQRRCQGRGPPPGGSRIWAAKSGPRKFAQQRPWRRHVPKGTALLHPAATITEPGKPAQRYPILGETPVGQVSVPGTEFFC